MIEWYMFNIESKEIYMSKLHLDWGHAHSSILKSTARCFDLLNLMHLINLLLFHLFDIVLTCIKVKRYGHWVVERYEKSDELSVDFWICKSTEVVGAYLKQPWRNRLCNCDAEEVSWNYLTLKFWANSFLKHGYWGTGVWSTDQYFCSIA